MAYTHGDRHKIHELIQGALIGSRIITQDQVDSTNDLAKRNFLEGSMPGTVFIADSQTQGRGRLGREWLSEPGTGIYLSVILATPPQPETAPRYTLIAAVGLVNALTEFSPVKPELKWPNDVLLNGKKVAGILSEYVVGNGRTGIVIGIGVNCNQTVFPPPLDSIATSLMKENDVLVDRALLIAEILNHMDEAHRQYEKSGLPPILTQWAEHSEMFNRKVTVQQGDQQYSGTALRLDDEGHLVVLTDEGEERSFNSGEVTLQM